jgi:Cu/Ag efflux protein CusF
VDLDKHELTLKAENGKEFTINVPDSVSRLDNVKQGDKVRVSFYESLAVSLQKPGEGAPTEQRRTFNERSTGELPSGQMGTQMTTTATIKNIDSGANELTIETPSGQRNTIQITDPQLQAELKKMKVGDQVTATYTKALATNFTAGRRM